MGPVEADELLTRIYDFLYRMGLTANLCGFSYLSGAAYLFIREPERFATRPDALCREIAQRHHVPPRDVRSGIRRALFLVWKRKPDFDGTPRRHFPPLEEFLLYARRCLDTPDEPI